MEKIIIILLSMTIPIVGMAQVESVSNWQFSYYGDVLFHPGVKVGYEIPLRNWSKTKTRRGVEKTKYKSLNTGIDLIYYWHPQHHHGLILSPNVTYRRIKQNGKFFQLKLNAGFHRSFVDGQTYNVDNSGMVTQKGLAGQTSFYNALSFGFGKDLRVSKHKALRYLWEIGINGRFPYNKSYLPGIHLGLGIQLLSKK